MKKGTAVPSVVPWCAFAMVVLVLVTTEVHITAAANCNAMELLPCAGAITGGQNPSSACCEKLKEQEPCFCGYLRNPQFKPYIDSPNAKKVASACGVSIPKC